MVRMKNKRKKAMSDRPQRCEHVHDAGRPATGLSRSLPTCTTGVAYRDSSPKSEVSSFPWYLEEAQKIRIPREKNSAPIDSVISASYAASCPSAPSNMQTKSSQTVLEAIWFIHLRPPRRVRILDKLA
jgi:hypothetical protein